MHANLILVFDKGRIVQRGTHNELMRESGIYRQIFDLQSRIEEEVEKEAADSSDFQFEEEEDFSDSRVNTNTLFRILSAVRPHWRWVAGFLFCVGVVSVFEGFFTFLSKRIVDEAIIPRNSTALVQTLEVYGVLAAIFALMVFGFIYLAGGLG